MGLGAPRAHEGGRMGHLLPLPIIARFYPRLCKFYAPFGPVARVGVAEMGEPWNFGGLKGRPCLSSDRWGRFLHSGGCSPMVYRVARRWRRLRSFNLREILGKSPAFGGIGHITPNNVQFINSKERSLHFPPYCYNIG